RRQALCLRRLGAHFFIFTSAAALYFAAHSTVPLQEARAAQGSAGAAFAVASVSGLGLVEDRSGSDVDLPSPRRTTRMFRNILAAAVCTALLAAPAAAAEKKIQLKVAGNLLATGLILKEKEQPFFEKLAETTGLPIDVDYKPMDVTGIKDV